MTPTRTAADAVQAAHGAEGLAPCRAGAACPCLGPLPHAPGGPVCVSAAWLCQTLGFGTGADASDNLAGLCADLEHRGDTVGVRTLNRVLDRLALVRVAATGRDERAAGAWEECLAVAGDPQAQDHATASLDGAWGGSEGVGATPTAGEASTGVTGAIGRERG